jgi:CBS domain-containing protein
MFALSFVVYAATVTLLVVASAATFVFVRETLLRRISRRERRRMDEASRFIRDFQGPPEALAASARRAFSLRVLERAVVRALEEGQGEPYAQLAHALGLVDRTLSRVREASAWSERAAAAALLGRLGVASAVPALVETLRDVDPEKVTVEDAMSADPYTVAPDAPLDEVVQAMAEHKYGAAIVTQNHHVVGILSTVDVCRALHDLLHGRLAK